MGGKMKIHILLTGVLLATVRMASGQDEGNTGGQAGSCFFGSLGVKGGLSLSNQLYRFTPIDYTLETSPILGPSLYFFAEAFRGEHFSMQTDIGFACRGSSTTIESVTVNHLEQDRVTVNQGESAASRFRYLSLAPMLRARTGNGRVMPYALVGPRIELLLYYTSESEHPLEEQNKLNLGLSFGAGAEFQLDRVALDVELQYQPDLSYVTDVLPLEVRNGSLFLGVGVRWNRVH
jgi:opacity protein-like surface antigen